MNRKQSINPNASTAAGFDHLTDVELLRRHNPVTSLECALYARLSSCLSERDAIHTDLTQKFESATSQLESTRAELSDAVQLNSDLCTALESLKQAARAVVDHWAQGNLAHAVNELRHAVARS